MKAILPAASQGRWIAWARWSLSFAGFPLAGVAARALAGPIDSATAAIVGGVAAGAVLGAVQAIALPSSTTQRIRWTAASAVGMGIGLAIGGSAVNFKTDTASLVTMGALTGAVVGCAQAIVAELPAGRRFAWAAGTPLLWAVGWLITSQVIVDAERQHAMFGSSGALAVTLLSGLIINPAARAHTDNRNDAATLAVAS